MRHPLPGHGRWHGPWARLYPHPKHKSGPEWRRAKQRGERARGTCKGGMGQAANTDTREEQEGDAPLNTVDRAPRVPFLLLPRPLCSLPAALHGVPRALFARAAALALRCATPFRSCALGAGTAVPKVCAALRVLAAGDACSGAQSSSHLPLAASPQQKPPRHANSTQARQHTGSPQQGIAPKLREAPAPAVRARACPRSCSPSTWPDRRPQCPRLPPGLPLTSTAGFHQGSMRKTCEAAVRLSATPPALRLMRNTRTCRRTRANARAQRMQPRPAQTRARAALRGQVGGRGPLRPRRCPLLARSGRPAQRSSVAGASRACVAFSGTRCAFPRLPAASPHLGVVREAVDHALALVQRHAALEPHALDAHLRTATTHRRNHAAAARGARPHCRLPLIQPHATITAARQQAGEGRGRRAGRQCSGRAEEQGG